MGFYGKIEHTDKLNFVIDKIYPNRKEMEESISEDGVFIGRYVLIEYEQTSAASYTKLYKSPSSEDFYFDVNLTAATRAKYTEDKSKVNGDYYIELNEIIYIEDENKVKKFYKCTGKNSIYATFTETYEPETNGTYHVNYTIDINKYGESRGYDSTVWQKVYVDEKEKYVMIAELNSVVPTLDITVDPPTLNPIPPHFDADSNNVYYKLHMQPSWGFKVKEAIGDIPSDVTVTATLAEWDDTNKTINKKHRNYKGAIYFNRDGFNPDYHYNKNDNEVLPTDNKIQLTTEASGRKYNTAHGSTDHHDIQALEIILPGIGRAISELWDLAYGTGDYIDGDNTKKARNKEINWDTVTGLRLVKTSRNPNISGFEYDTQSVDTIAGCINSVHDLIGMIIVNDKDEKIEIDEALVNRIYYRDGQYWIKDLTYEYTEVSDEDQIIDNMKQFGDNYYYKNGNNYYKELEGYRAGNQYYEFGPNVVSEVKLCQEVWKANTYYYQEGEDYKLDPSTYPDETKQYYKISQDLDGILGVDNQKGENGLCFFPTTYNETTYNKLFPTVKATATSTGKGLFYTGKDANGKTGYLPFEQGKGIQYQTPLHYWDGYEIEISTTTDGEFIETYEFGKATYTPVVVIPFVENTFYYLDDVTKEWTLLKSEADIDVTKTYYQFSEGGIEKVVIDGRFYEPNLYYYLDYVDYIMDIDKDREPNIDYYIIDESAIEAVSENTIFYEPNKYYYKDGEEYILDTAKDMTPGRVYYKNIYTRYVGPESTNKNFNIGQVWNEEIKDIPTDVKLTNRKESYKWKQLNGFARTLNTINGLILKINNVMKFDDTLTRDNKTVQGCINMINDIIDTIDTLKPNHVIAVNEFGHMTSMATETDKWIDVKINDENNDKIIITHTYNPVADTTNATNINDNGNTINLYTPKVDAMGHIIGKNTETVTLPFGYKTFQDSETTPGKTVAQNTQDILTLKGDSWIKPTISQGEIKYSHIGPVKSSEAAQANKTPNFGDTFVIEDWYFDDKGHQSNKTTHTVKIPKGSLTAEAENGADVITQIGFTPETGAITTTRKNIANLKLTDYVKSNDNTDIAHGDTLGAALSKLQTQIIEEENERASAIQSTASDFTTLLNKEVEDRKAAITQEANTRTAAISKEIEDRTNAVAQEKAEREAAITAEATTRANAITQEIADRNAAILVETNARIAAINQEVVDRNAAILVETNARTTAIEKEINDRNAAILVETNARIKAINDLDATITSETSEVITSIAQTDGLVSAGKKKIGELSLTGWTLGENVVDSTPIADTDNVFNAFAKTQRQINANKTALAVLNGNSTTPGSVAYQIAEMVINADDKNGVDKLSEIAAWIVSDTTGAAKMNADIGKNTTNIALNTASIEALESLVGNTAVATQIANAINTALTIEGKSKYALATDLINLSAALDNINGRVEKLENAVPAEKIAKWDAAVQKEEYNVKIAELEQADYTLNSRCNVLDKEVKNLINLVAELQTKIAELEAQ